jgi:hypothetical protein
MLKRRREKHTGGTEGKFAANMMQKNAHKSKGNNKVSRKPTSRRRGGTRRIKNLDSCAAWWAIGLIAVRNARERRVKLDRTLTLSTWSLAILRKELLGMVNFYQLFFWCFIPQNGGLIRVLMFMCVLTPPFLPLIRAEVHP